MANMSYCRFENTVSDMEDCVNALCDVVYDGEDISNSERSRAKEFIRICKQIAEEFEEDQLNKKEKKGDEDE
mgnify:CR=1 FL=1